MQVAGEAFPTIILQQHDGVYPNVTNSTGTVSVVYPSGTSVISVNVPREVDQMVADQVKRYDDAGNPLDSDEILPGYSKEKRRHNVCQLICTPSSLNDICEGSLVFEGCTGDCTVSTASLFVPPGGNVMGPLRGSNIETQPDVILDADRATCLSHCSCTGGYDERLVDGGSNEDDPFQGLD